MNKLIIYFLLKILAKTEKKIEKLHTKCVNYVKNIDERVLREMEKWTV